VRAEQDAVFRDLAQIAQAKDLEAARVGQNRARPRHEAVQAAQLADQFVSGAEEQVIRIGQDDVGVEFAFEIALHHPLDGGLRPDGHKYRSFDDAVSGVNPAGPGAGVRALGDEFKLHYFTVSVIASANRLV
jgi:hypothetical protein